MTIHALTLTNPGAETGNATGWTASAGSLFTSATTYAAPPILPHSGSRFFLCGFNDAETIYQQVDVSAYATTIDAGTAGSYGRVYQNNNSTSPLAELFISAIANDGTTVLGTVNLEGFQAHQNLWYPREEWYKFLPTGTRFLRIGIINNAGAGGQNSFDDFYLEISDDAAADYPTLIRISQAATLTAWIYPTQALNVSQAAVLTAVTSHMPVQVSQAAVLVLWKGRTQNPKLRAWTFSLDGHDFYVLRLGMTTTLVYDLYAQEWVEWDAFLENYWPVNIGINWLGATGIADTFGSNVVVGDDTFGLLWLLDPQQPYDENPNAGGNHLYFPRVTQGQLAIAGREVLPCYAVWLTTDMGAPAYTGAGVLLETSDDAGKTYDSAGTVTVTPGENSPELSWYSLGQISAPGRLFRITDDGAVARIDGMEMNDPDDKNGG